MWKLFNSLLRTNNIVGTGQESLLKYFRCGANS